MNRIRIVPLALLGVAAVAALACSSDGPTAIEIPLAEVEIITPCPTVDIGASCPMSARGITAEGQIVTNAVLRWSSSNPSAVQVNSDGRVFGLGVGKSTILVEAAVGQGSDTSEVVVFGCTKCN